MILHIDDYKSVEDLQEKFSECFPSLKIEFYDETHHYKESSSPDHQITPDRKIGTIRRKHEPGNLVIKSYYTVGRVEKDFKEKFGLNVQIFRSEINTWIQTSASDMFTLKEQADMAFNATHSVFPMFKKQLDEYEEL